MMMTTSSRKKLMAISHYPCIPDEILFFNILITLPVKPLLRFKCVSKQWKSMIEDPEFIQSHFICAIQKSSSSIVGLFEVIRREPKWGNEYFYIPKESLGYLRIQSSESTRKVGICNGLLCNRSRDGFEICNPGTCEFLYHPWPQAPPPRCDNCYGFGYDPIKNEYKVVQIVQGERNFYRCMVYTLGSSNESWKDITTKSDLVSCLNHYLLDHSGGLSGVFNFESAVYDKGALHWLIGHKQMILSFDIHYEKFSLIRGPKVVKSLTGTPYFISKWDGCMCFGSEARQVPKNDFICFGSEIGLLPNSEHNSVRVLKYALKERQHLNPRIFDAHILQDLMVDNLPTWSIIGCLGGESKLFYWFGDGQLSLYSPEDTGLYSQECETRERFPLPPGVDDSEIFEYEFMHHINNPLSLKTLVPLGSNQTRYSKNNSAVQDRSVPLYENKVRRELSF